MDKPQERRYLFRGAGRYDGVPIEYTIDERNTGTCKMTELTITKKRTLSEAHISFDMEALPMFIAELQDLLEFAYDHDILSKPEPDENEEDPQ